MSESLRIDETAPAASLALERRESLFSAVVGFILLLGSADFPGGDLALSEEAFHTVMGTAANDRIPSSPEGFPASAMGSEGGSGPKTGGTSANEGEPRSISKTGEARDDEARSGLWTRRLEGASSF